MHLVHTLTIQSDYTTKATLSPLHKQSESHAVLQTQPYDETTYTFMAVRFGSREPFGAACTEYVRNNVRVYILMNTFIYTRINEYEREIRVQQGDQKALFKFITAHIGDLDTNKL